jgi:hypothetical protein
LDAYSWAAVFPFSKLYCAAAEVATHSTKEPIVSRMAPNFVIARNPARLSARTRSKHDSTQEMKRRYAATPAGVTILAKRNQRQNQ